MSEDSDRPAWRVTADPDRIEALAAEHGVTPVLTDEPDGGTRLGLVDDPGAIAGEELSWAAFRDRFDPDEHAGLYRDEAPVETDRPAVAVVARGALSERVGGEEKLVEPDDTRSDQLAVGDTGEGEPVVFDATASEGATGGGGDEEPAERADRDATRDDVEGPESTSAGGGAEGELVLDEIHEAASSPDDEYLVFRNEAEDPLDVSGWTVENDAGRSYAFPDGTVLDPGDGVTLYSGRGADDHLSWGADEVVWDETGDVVTVRTADGREILREPYGR
ncbi:lamin tail domain-containing protein [Halomicrobium salinisoli]|uniref:lamin tail domain-containing protein n=1 Tax=Halomicrobium salinisoli TaxID=2878391 RepID=UPI001CF0834A|nr:lamin tail domain-containing protein [Halomicrobium salinisoli]